LQEELKPVSKGKFNPDVEPYSYIPERNAFSSAGSVTPRYLRDKEIANTIQNWIDEQRKTGRSTDIVPYRELFYPGESPNKPGRPEIQGAASDGAISKQIEDFNRERASEGGDEIDFRAKLDEVAPKKSTPKNKKSSAKAKSMERGELDGLAKQAVGLRDSRRDALAPETIPQMMKIFDQVSERGTLQDVKDFMRAVDVVPTSKSKKRLRKEFQDFCEDVSTNRGKATTIRKMGGNA
jgi:hypothetical protein